MQNLSLVDYVCAHAVRISDIIRAFSIYRSRFSNYFYILRMRARKQFPITAKLRNGTETVISNNRELLSILFGFSYNDETNITSLDNGLKMYSAIDNGDLIGVFCNNEYDFLTVEEKTVIDIGANIGDYHFTLHLRVQKKS